MKNIRQTRIFLISILIISIATVIGFSTWLISDSINIKPSPGIDKVITRYLSGNEGTYDGNVLLPSSEAIGLVNNGRNIDLKYFYKSEMSSGDYVECVDSDKSIGPIDAGKYCIKVIYVDVDNDNKSTIIEGIEFTILKANIDISALKFDNETKTYNRENQLIDFTSPLPKGVENVTISGGGVDVGEYDVVATFKVNKNYNQIDPLKAILTIIPKDITTTNIDFNNKISTKDGIFLFLGNSTINEIKSNLIVKDLNDELIINEDYLTIWENSDLQIGSTYQLTIKGQNNYTGSIIVKYELQRPLIYIEEDNDNGYIQNFTYNAEVQYPKVKAYFIINEKKEYIQDFNLTDYQVKFYNYNDYENNAILSEMTELKPVDANQYKVFAIALNDNYETPNYVLGSGIQPSVINYLISQKELKVTWTNTLFEYDKQPHMPTATVTGICEKDKATCTYTVSGEQINAGNYSATITLNQSKKNYILKINTLVSFTIKKRIINTNVPLVELTYNKDYRTWNQVSKYLKNSIQFDSTNILEGDTITPTIIGMHNGIFGYGTTNIDGLNDSSKIGVNIGSNYNYVVGSTYTVIASVDNPNYEVKLGSIIFKYKTVIVNGNYYTIEDAINSTNGNISFIGDASSFNSFVYTSFCGLTKEQGSPYTSTTFEIKSGRQLLVPHKENQDFLVKYDIYEGVSPLSQNFYTCLYIPNNILLDIKGTLTISSVIAGSGRCGNSGGIINNGNIKMESGSKLYSYGFIKGHNTITLESGSNAMEVMVMHDWSSASNASSVYNAGCFPVTSWNVHNIGCILKVKKGAKLEAHTSIYGSSFFVGYKEIDFIVINSEYSSSTNCLFMPSNDSSANDYIIKQGLDSSGKPLVSLINDSKRIENQERGQKDLVEVHGKYDDNQLSINIYVSITTSTSLSVPLSYFDLIITENSSLTLSKSSYCFLLGTKLEIEKNAIVEINNGYVAFDTLDSNKKSTLTGGFFNDYCSNPKDASLINNGTITGSGYIGGKVQCNSKGALFESVNYSIDTIKMKNAASSGGTISNYKLLGTIYDSNTNTISENAEFASGPWLSDIKNDMLCWVTSTDVTQFTINFYDSDKTTLLKSVAIKKLNINGESLIYEVTGDEYTPSKAYYSFVRWINDSGISPDHSDNFKLTQNNLTMNLYAVWELKEYKFSYLAGYGMDGTKPNYVPATIINDQVSFTINDFVNNVLTITARATYEPTLNDTKVFRGWYIGIDKSLDQRFNSITLEQFEKYLQKFENPEKVDTLYLFCEFVDKVINITFNTDIGTVNGETNLEIVAGESIELPNLDNNTLGSYNGNNKSSRYFAGWVISGDESKRLYKPGIFSNTTDDIIFEACWLDKEVVLTIKHMNLDDSSILQEEQQYYIGDSSNHAVIGEIIGSDLTVNDLKYRYKESSLEEIEISGGTWTLSSNSVVTLKYNQLFSISIDANKATIQYYVDEDSGHDSSLNFIATKGQTIRVYVKYSDSDERSTTITPTVKIEILNNTSVEAEIYEFKFTMPASNVTIKATSSCIVEGTLITLADGTKKKIEDLALSDKLLTFNHEKGTYDSSSILFINSHNNIKQMQRILNLEFSDGTKLKVVQDHGLFDMDLLKYIYISESNYKDYIGHKFYKGDYDGMNYQPSYTSLTNAYVTQEEVRIYAIITVGTMNCYTEGLLSMPTIPYNSNGLVNIFEYDSDLRYNQEKYNADLEKYGVFTYEDFKDFMSYEAYLASPAKYLKVSMGKGYITYDEIVAIIEYLLSNNLIE